MTILKHMIASLVLTVLLATAASSQNGIDPEALIDRILGVDRQQRDALRTLSMDAEYIEYDGDGVEIRLDKRIYVKYEADTAYYAEEFHQLIYGGREDTRANLKRIAEEKREQKHRRGLKDISINLLAPFYADQRHRYNITYVGVAPGRIEGLVCHQFRVIPVMEEDDLITGTYFFEAETFHLVKVDFSPARLVDRALYQLERLDLTIVWGPHRDGLWLPKQLEVEGRDKSALFFGVDFSFTEYYRNPTINADLDPSLFEE